MPDVTLQVAGRLYGGWKSIRITRGIEQIAGSFELTVSDRWPGQETARPIRPGQACTVAIDKETVITGYVDDVLPHYNAREHTVTVAGRDRTGDLVDCSVYPAGEWRGRTLLQVAVEICKPFGVTVRAEVDTGAPFNSAAAQPGETGFEALERAARMRGLLLVADGLGGLVLTRASKTRVTTPLVRGQNILAASTVLSWRERFSRYLVQGQDSGSNWSTPEQNTQPQGEALDNSIDRYRPLLVLAEYNGNTAQMQERAKWEAAVRLGRATRAMVTVQGWRHGAGLWLPNRLVRLTDDWLGVDRDLLIAAVSCLYDEGGSRCELELVRPEAFALIALPEDEGGMLWG